MSAHIVALRYGDAIKGFQLRHDGGSAHFAVGKLGGVKAAEAQAKAAAAALGLTLKTYPQRSLDGIRWRWMAQRTGVNLYVVTTYRDHAGKMHCTGYSTAVHGLGGALDLAIFARKTAGHKVKHRGALLAALQAEYETRGRS